MATHQRKSYCSGFLIPTSKAASHNKVEPYDHVSHFSRDGDIPTTRICDHVLCRPGEDYMYAMRAAIARGELDTDSFRNALPKAYLTYYPQGTAETPQCSGFRLIEKSNVYWNGSRVQKGVHVDPISLNPYTEAC